MEHSKKTRFDSDGNPYQIVGALDKAAAFIIDSVIMLALSVAIVVLLMFVQFDMTMELSESELSRLAGQMTIAFPLISFIYFFASWVKFSKTPGLKMIGGVIVDETSQRKPEIWQFIVRYAGYYLFMLPYYFGYLAFAWALFDERKQAMHDKFAKTLTIRYEKQQSQSLTEDETA